jgi:hypothetical protein
MLFVSSCWSVNEEDSIVFSCSSITASAISGNDDDDMGDEAEVIERAFDEIPVGPPTARKPTPKAWTVSIITTAIISRTETTTPDPEYWAEKPSFMFNRRRRRRRCASAEVAVESCSFVILKGFQGLLPVPVNKSKVLPKHKNEKRIDWSDDKRV